MIDSNYHKAEPTYSGNLIHDLYFCDKDKYPELTDKTVVSNYIKYCTIAILSALRIIYFIYVIVIVKRNSKKLPFFKRPFFVNWLPIFILITSCFTLIYGMDNIVWRTRYEDDGALCANYETNVIIRLIPLYLTGLSIYLFTSEFVMIFVSLRSVTEGLEIAVSDFVSEREALEAIEKPDIKVRMDAHLKALKK